MFDSGNFEEAIEAFKRHEASNPKMENPIIAYIIWRKLFEMLESKDVPAIFEVIHCQAIQALRRGQSEEAI